MTNRDPVSWWMVDIGGPHRVQSVVITNRDHHGNVAGEQSRIYGLQDNTRGFSKIPRLALLAFSYCLSMRMS